MTGFTFRVNFAREYHVGAGHGRGTDLDSALFTDDGAGRGGAAIRYGHGVLRQAVFDLLAADCLKELRRCKASGKESGPGFCTDASKEPPCPVCRIFGSPARRSPWSFGTMRRVSPVCAPARTVSRTAVDPATRRAREGALFSQELGAPGEFEFAVTRSRAAGDTANSACDEAALLAAAAAAVPGIGAGRRRGRGECTLTLEPGDCGEDLLARFAEAWLGGRRGDHPVPLPGALADGPVVSGWVDAGAGEWEEYRIVARLREPVVAGNRPLVGNLLPSEPFIPGTLLMGAIAALALESGAADEQFLRAFRGGGVLWPDLLPSADGGDRYRPGLPAPRDLFTCRAFPGPKAAGGHGFWRGTAASEEPPGCAVCREKQLPAGKPSRLAGYLFDPADGFDTLTGDAYELPDRMGQETKIAVDPATGRVADESLYHRKTIAAGTLVSGILLARPGALTRFVHLLGVGGDKPVSLRMGKRHGRGYGAVDLTCTLVSAAERAAARERLQDAVGALLATGKPVPLVCATRTLLRDGLGRYAQSLTPADLGLPASATVNGSAVHSAGVGGFWRHVGLPRRGGVALAPGSVLHVSGGGGAKERNELAAEIVSLALDRAVGERTEEGYGRIAVAPFPYDWTAGKPTVAGLANKSGPEVSADAYSAVRPVLGWGIPVALRTPSWEAIARVNGTAGADCQPGGAMAGLVAAAEPTVQERLRLSADAFRDDRWRTVARILWTHAGADFGALGKALEGTAGPIHQALVDAHALRKPKHFLTGGDNGTADGASGWVVLEPLIRAAAASPAPFAATRALADVLADTVEPGKVATPAPEASS